MKIEDSNKKMMGEDSDWSGWWTLLLFFFMSQEPEFFLPSMVETVYECPDCGQRYFGDPYYVPNHCDRCGGIYVEKVVKKTFPVKNGDGSFKMVTKEYE